VRTEPGDHVGSRAVKSCHARSRQRRNTQTTLMVWQFDNRAAPSQFLYSQSAECVSQAALENGQYNGVLYENRSRNRAILLKNARSPITTSRVKIDIDGPHHDVRRYVTREEGQARVFTKTQQVNMNLGIRDNAKLVHIVHDVLCLGAHKRVDKCRCAHGHACGDIDNVKLRFSKVQVVEFTRIRKRRVLSDVLEH